LEALVLLCLFYANHRNLKFSISNESTDQSNKKNYPIKILKTDLNLASLNLVENLKKKKVGKMPKPEQC